MAEKPNPLPVADPQTGLLILKGLARERSLLTALILMQKHVGNAFQVTLPRFQPAVLVGPQSNRQILVTERDKFFWRTESDPVTRVLHKGVLVLDGGEHDNIRQMMDTHLQRRNVIPKIETMWGYTNDIARQWDVTKSVDMLVEMRKIALLILMGTLFDVEFAPDMSRLWKPILHILEYISPGLWIFSARQDSPTAGIRHPKYKRAMHEIDKYLYSIIEERWRALGKGANGGEGTHADLLSHLIATPGLTDDLIRDQLLTLLIAGHDTSTALLAWVFYLLGSHPESMAQVRTEVDKVIGRADQPPSIEQLNQLEYMEKVIKEALRMYPPIHVGNRKAAQDIVLQGYDVPEGTRVMYSIYLSHRDAGQWKDPNNFNPERFDKVHGEKTPPMTYVPFGGGPRNCIGAAFAQIESKVVLARLFQLFDFRLLNAEQIRPYMGATLEPRPGVRMRIWHRR